MSAEATTAGETELTRMPYGPRKSAMPPVMPSTQAMNGQPRVGDTSVDGYIISLLVGPYVMQRAGTGWATAEAMLTMQPLSSVVRGPKGPSSGYWLLMASAMTESTAKVPYAFMFSTLAKS